ncbi:MAG: MBL fold metallo-hydrolase [Candidatus Thermoplasmatota archaeon]|nr:MBL fold metallo-hydrolase [Candidatus Thermoplasmatota archaeon]
MNLTVLYDNEALEGFKKGWGFSCLVEHRGRKILFDTGWDGRKLMYNMKKAGIRKEDIDIIVLSHDHWDHIGGLTRVLHPKADVYLPCSFSKRLKKEISEQAHLHEVEGPVEVMEGIYMTGQLGERTREQAMAVDTGNGILVITGCAHPGLNVLMDAAGRFGRVTGVMGGFHDFDKLDRLGGLDMIVPCHCTERKKEIIMRFPDRARTCSAGQIISLDRGKMEGSGSHH